MRPSSVRAVAALSLTMVLTPMFVCDGQGIQVKTMDLSKAAAHDTVELKPGRYQFKIASRVPAYTYMIETSGGVEEVEPIKYPSAQALTADNACAAVNTAATALERAKEETAVPDLKNGLQKALDALKDDSCKAKRPAETLIARIDTIPDDIFDLGAGQYVVVSVSRMEDGKATQRWERHFTTGAPGSWRATYGYAFPFFSSWNGKPEGQQLYSQKLDSARYTIQQQRRTKAFDALPSIMFSYVPVQQESLQLAWSAGIGTDITKAQLMTGPSVTLWSNLVIAAGVAFREEEVPTGRYTVGDTVKENIDSEQLKDKAFRARPFVSISFRFDKNPFSTGKGASATDTKKAEAQPETKPTDTKKGAKPAAAGKDSSAAGAVKP